jgi:acetyltransferase-like isoleucine patch superfamily enzyme
MNGVFFSYDFKARGIPIINVNLKGVLRIGNKFTMHSGKYYNMIGRQQQCYFVVGKNAQLIIGNNVGISCTSMVAASKIEIEDNVRIGGGVVIYDTDFHSLAVEERICSPEITTNIKVAPVKICSGAFIGAHSIILKGVTIGENAVIGAGSVVAKSIPANEIWAGNPAKFIKRNE